MTIRATANDAGKRLDSFLHECLPGFSRSRLQSWIKDGRVLLSADTQNLLPEKPTRASYIVRGHELIVVDPGPLAPLKAEAEELPLDILYQDSEVVVVNKAAGMVVHMGAGHHRGTLVNALLHRFGRLSSLNGDFRPGIVHRLDRDTSGVLVIARTDQAHQSLARQFQQREVEKRYLALVNGRLKQKQGRITSPIARDPVRRTRMTAGLGSGRSALTDYTVREEFERMTYLDVGIGTGRTHQIRVHLASLHHPVVGDRLYGAPPIPSGLPPLGRFFLHASQLRFRLPSSGEWLAVDSPLPPDLSAFLQSARSNAARIESSR